MTTRSFSRRTDLRDTVYAADVNELQAAIEALSVLTTAGDLTIGGTAGAEARLARGSLGSVLKSTSSTVAWQTPHGIDVRDYGATGDGTTDDTAAIQAAIDAAPAGARITVPAGVYKFSAITVDEAKTLAGTGWRCLRDAVEAFADADYATAANFTGSILRSTASSGTAITVVTTGETIQGHLENLCVIGPGSGTAVGVKIGTTTRAVVNPVWRNVMVCNFASGVQMLNINDGQFDSLIIRGCTTGLALSNSTNNNLFNMLDLQRCVTGLTDDSTCLANLFNAPLFQSNTGTSAVLTGSNVVLQTPYFENASGVRAVDMTGGQAIVIHSPRLAGTGNESIRVGSGVLAAQIIAPTAGAATAIDILAGANGTLVIGDLTSSITVNDAGTNTTYLDTRGNRSKLPAVQTGLSLDALASGQFNLTFRDATTAKWSIRKINASGNLLIYDEANARTLAQFAPGATSILSGFVVSGVIGMGSSTTANRPNATNFAAGGMWYDTTLSKPIWTDGTVWRDAAGTAV